MFKNKVNLDLQTMRFFRVLPLSAHVLTLERVIRRMSDVDYETCGRGKADERNRPIPLGWALAGVPVIGILGMKNHVDQTLTRPSRPSRP